MRRWKTPEAVTDTGERLARRMAGRALEAQAGSTFPQSSLLKRSETQRSDGQNRKRLAFVMKRLKGREQSRTVSES